MILYWLLFGFAAAMALFAPVNAERRPLGPAQTLVILVFLVAYVALAGLRYRIGGDWEAYDEMYDVVRQGSLGDAIAFTDPAFGTLLWISARLGLGIYLVDAISAALIAYGAVRVALTTRDPWLAITAAVPYVLIVIGMGYVRQAAAIGVIMVAIASADRSRWTATIARLALASGFHSTASVTYPLFGRVIARHSRPIAIAAALIGGIVFLTILSGRLDEYESGYISQEYGSGGTMVRLLISLLPSLLLLLRRRWFRGGPAAREIWLGCAVANVVALAALLISPSSTAVDRMALYFLPIQLVVFGDIMDLVPVQRTGAYLLRTVGILLAGSVQAVWLVFGTHANLWVPYRSILEFV